MNFQEKSLTIANKINVFAGISDFFKAFKGNIIDFINERKERKVLREDYNNGCVKIDKEYEAQIAKLNEAYEKMKRDLEGKRNNARNENESTLNKNLGQASEDKRKSFLDSIHHEVSQEEEQQRTGQEQQVKMTQTKGIGPEL